MHLLPVNIMNLINKLTIRFILDIANQVYVTNRVGRMILLLIKNVFKRHY